MCMWSVWRRQKLCCKWHVQQGVIYNPMRAAAPGLLPWGPRAYVNSAAQAEHMSQMACATGCSDTIPCAQRRRSCCRGARTRT